MCGELLCGFSIKTMRSNPQYPARNKINRYWQKIVEKQECPEIVPGRIINRLIKLSVVCYSKLLIHAYTNNFMQKPERIVKIKHFTCPFCDSKANVQVKDVFVEGDRESGFTADGWTCKTCGSNNAIYDELDFSMLREMSAERLEKMDDFDVLELLTFAEHLVQKKEFEKAVKIMKHVSSQDKNYDECEYILEKVEKVLKLKELAGINIDVGEVMFAMEDHSGMSEHFLNIKTGKILSTLEPEDAEKIENSDDYFCIEPTDSSESYRKMEEFLEFIDDDENLKEKLIIALNGKGSFRRFKDVLAGYTGTTEYMDMWFDFYNSFLWNKAMDFLISVFKKEG